MNLSVIHIVGFCILGCIYPAQTYSQDIWGKLLDCLQIKHVDSLAIGENSYDFKGNLYRVRKDSTKVIHIGKFLFPDQMRETENTKVLDFVEAAFACHTFSLTEPRFKHISFTKGTWEDLEKVNDSTACSLTNLAGRSYRIKWNSSDRKVIMTFPIEYDKLNNGTREEIEEAFISGLKRYKVTSVRPQPTFSILQLQLLKDSLFLLPGDKYIISNVNSHSYLIPSEDGNAIFVYDRAFPAESLANLFTVGNERGMEIEIEIDVIKHEYGIKETLIVPLETLVQYGIMNGCRVYWGTESVEQGELKASVIFYNPDEGYDHIFRIKCPLSEWDSDSFRIQARASLFIPTSNVDNLLQ